ncbi:MAG: hypothetical protein GX219_02195 [Tissierellia bacterium]|nr:hypothetical protein [Tissierellia bacterium]
MRILFLIFLLLVSCSQEETEARVLKRINDNIKREESIEALKEDLNSLYELVKTEDSEYLIEDLNNDNVPELVIYRGRDMENIKDSGEIICYTLIDKEYQRESIPLAFDKELKEMQVGTLRDGERAVFIKTSVGKNYENFYVIGIREGVENLIQSDLLSYLSVIPEGEIGDRNNNGFTDFTILMGDPDFEDEKIYLTYEYVDGGFKLVKLGRKNFTPTTAFIEINKEDSFALSDLEDFSKIERYLLINKYIGFLSERNPDRKAAFLENIKALGVEDFPTLISEYGIGLKNLNDPEFVEKSGVFSQRLPVKLALIKLLTDGYSIYVEDGQVQLGINYGYLEKKFAYSKDYSSFLQILAEDFYLKEKDLNYNNYKEILEMMEDFLIKYPYSNYFNFFEGRYKGLLKELIKLGGADFDTEENPFSFSGAILQEAKDKSIDGEIKEEDLKILFDKVDRGSLKK